MHYVSTTAWAQLTGPLLKKKSYASVIIVIYVRILWDRSMVAVTTLHTAGQRRV